MGKGPGGPFVRIGAISIKISEGVLDLDGLFLLEEAERRTPLERFLWSGEERRLIQQLY